MTLKIHFFNSHLDQFPDNLGDVRDNNGKYFHQDIKVIEERYQGQWYGPMMAGYIQSNQRHYPDIKHSSGSSELKSVPWICSFLT